MNSMDLRKTLSKNIKDKRKSLMLTQEKLAEETGLSAQTINDIEGCRTWVSDKTLVKLSKVLHTTPAELLLNNISEKSNETDFLQFKIKIQNTVHDAIEDAFSQK